LVRASSVAKAQRPCQSALQLRNKAAYLVVGAAQDALLELAETPLGRKYKAAIAVWERAWGG
jgi:hypothetical protein